MQTKIVSPARMVLLLTVSIFLTEFLLMVVLWYELRLSELEKSIIDACSLVIVLSPVIYFLVYRPLRMNIKARLAVEKELRNRNRELDMFVENVAHSLRSALNTMVGAAWYLQDKYQGRLEQGDDKLLSVIQHEGKRVLEIVGDLVSLSRLEQGETQGDAVDVGEVVREVLNTTSGERGEKKENGGIISIGDLPPAYVSRSHLTLMLENLLKNALRYGEKQGSSIEVYGRSADGVVRVYVRDHGIGVPAEERDRIFEVLYRGAKTRHIPGSGVGLALVRKVAHLYGGDVRLEETPGGGATFCLELRNVPRT